MIYLDFLRKKMNIYVNYYAHVETTSSNITMNLTTMSIDDTLQGGGNLVF